ncbi:MAG: N-acetyltransferase [Deltaproteobacteria bacterium]|nr:N-acetyltransferase [Deltaproteobacteria bacterium]
MTVELVEVPLHVKGWGISLPWGGFFRTSAGKLIDRFIRVQWTANARYPGSQWVAPLMMDRRDYLDVHKNPFFSHAEVGCWIAVKNGEDVGRIAAVSDAGWEKHHGDKVGYFGFFDCSDDQEVADALLAKATEFLRGQGRTDMVGPFDLSTNYQAGLLVDSFDKKPGVQMPYNPPYYETLILGSGLEQRKDLWQWWLSTGTPIPEKVVRVSEKVAKRNNVEIRQMDLAKWDDEVTKVLAIYNDAWDANWGFVPVGEEEFRHIAADLKMVVKPETALMAEVDGEPIAFCISIIDMNQALDGLNGSLVPTGLFKLLWRTEIKKDFVKRGRLIVMGVKSGYRRRGADSILFVETHRGANKLGWDGAEIGWTLDDNDMVNRAIESMHGTKIKTYRVFGRTL